MTLPAFCVTVRSKTSLLRMKVSSLVVGNTPPVHRPGTFQFPVPVPPSHVRLAAIACEAESIGAAAAAATIVASNLLDLDVGTRPPREAELAGIVLLLNSKGE